MGVVFCRIDDRLIHGQVITAWANVHNIEQIIILNDDVYSDKIQTSVLKMSAPPTIKLHIFPVEKFKEISDKNPMSRRTMLLFSTIVDVERLLNTGFLISDLNVGGMRMEGERVQLTKAVSVTDEERLSFKNVINLGVNVEIQMVPTEEKVNIKEVI